MCGHRREVLARGITLMAIEPVAGIVVVQSGHLAIAYHLSHYRRGGDSTALPVALHDSALSHQEVRNAKGVDDDHVRDGRQRPDGQSHRLERGAMDVQAV